MESHLEDQEGDRRRLHISMDLRLVVKKWKEMVQDRTKLRAVEVALCCHHPQQANDMKSGMTRPRENTGSSVCHSPAPAQIGTCRRVPLTLRHPPAVSSSCEGV